MEREGGVREGGKAGLGFGEGCRSGRRLGGEGGDGRGWCWEKVGRRL